jgi:hypothetical protein
MVAPNPEGATMAFREVTMLEIKEVVLLWLDRVPKKRIARQLGLDAKTVRRYLAAAAELGLAAGMPAAALTEDLCGQMALAVAVHMALELRAVPDNLLPTLLERDLHVPTICVTNVRPQRDLLAMSLHPGRMLRPHSASLWVSDVVLPHRPGELVGAHVDH